MVDTVVKIGGALLSYGALDQIIPHLQNAGERQARVVVVPGGGPFARTVRRLDRELGLSDDAAHWMAILGMDQYAHLLESRTIGARLVRGPEEIERARADGRLPVLAPYQWLRETDPLPHSWDVTSDSIAAWVAGELGARRIILVKPVSGERSALVDQYFESALASHIDVGIVVAEELGDALGTRYR